MYKIRFNIFVEKVIALVLLATMITFSAFQIYALELNRSDKDNVDKVVAYLAKTLQGQSPSVVQGVFDKIQTKIYENRNKEKTVAILNRLNHNLYYALYDGYGNLANGYDPNNPNNNKNDILVAVLNSADDKDANDGSTNNKNTYDKELGDIRDTIINGDISQEGKDCLLAKLDELKRQLNSNNLTEEEKMKAIDEFSYNIIVGISSCSGILKPGPTSTGIIVPEPPTYTGTISPVSLYTYSKSSTGVYVYFYDNDYYDSYILKRSTSKNGSYKQIYTINVNSTSFINFFVDNVYADMGFHGYDDGGLTPNTEYYYNLYGVKGATTTNEPISGNYAKTYEDYSSNPTTTNPDETETETGTGTQDGEEGGEEEGQQEQQQQNQMLQQLLGMLAPLLAKLLGGGGGGGGGNGPTPPNPNPNPSVDPSTLLPAPSVEAVQKELQDKVNGGKALCRDSRLDKAVEQIAADVKNFDSQVKIEGIVKEVMQPKSVIARGFSETTLPSIQKINFEAELKSSIIKHPLAKCFGLVKVDKTGDNSAGINNIKDKIKKMPEFKDMSDDVFKKLQNAAPALSKLSNKTTTCPLVGDCESELSKGINSALGRKDITAKIAGGLISSINGLAGLSSPQKSTQRGLIAALGTDDMSSDCHCVLVGAECKVNPELEKYWLYPGEPYDYATINGKKGIDNGKSFTCDPVSGDVDKKDANSTPQTPSPLGGGGLDKLNSILGAEDANALLNGGDLGRFASDSNFSGIVDGIIKNKDYIKNNLGSAVDFLKNTNLKANQLNVIMNDTNMLKLNIK